MFRIYVFAFDAVTYNVLSKMNLKNAVIISMDDFENEDLKRVKTKRSNAEYCWTCTPFTIDYVFEKYGEKICTYIDADIYFYCDPVEIFSEMNSTDSSIVIVEHRFPDRQAEKKNKIHGKYCVEFNTFVNNEYGRKCLSWWKDSCYEKCHYSKKTNECVGDQTYLESFESLFEGVNVTSILGAGVAPWNSSVYSYKFNECKEIIITKNKTEGKLIFYHFQNIRYLPFGLININSGTRNKFVKKNIYVPYLEEIERIRNYLLKNYGIKFSRKRALYKNRILGFIQNYIMPFKIKNIGDITKIRKEKLNDSVQ